MDIADRLVAVRGHQSRRSVAQELGISEGALRNYESGQTLPNSDFIKSFCQKFNISLDWLIYGEPFAPNRERVQKNAIPAYENKPSIAELQELIDKTTDRNGTLETFATALTEFILIPMVEAVLSAGTGSLQTESGSERKYAFRSDFLHRKGSIKDMVLMRVSGDSMSPAIEDGDVVLIDQSQKNLSAGKIYAVGVEDMIYLKRVNSRPGKIILHSDNEEYEPLEVSTSGDLADLVRIIGRVVWISREV